MVGDYIENDYEATNFRPATIEEVHLYMKYCSLEEEEHHVGDKHLSIIYSIDRTEVLYRPKNERIWWRVKKWFNKLKGEKGLPF